MSARFSGGRVLGGECRYSLVFPPSTSIAAILACTEAAARANVYQALKRLRTVLDAEGWQDEIAEEVEQRQP